ncbi:DNA repair RAD52-like protein 2, chloroplastic [Phalaenopsis equestris]|uniref:DNA repair RAD52-like protein 2, chloroplastic n=1 Tax=Phalaenopsis equestris TaxID=78828 RepID=UPI0009E1E576|nr:DNA repair RAD52-like protein 2, chloroplastic [Phalaenopsis equestris]
METASAVCFRGNFALPAASRVSLRRRRIGFGGCRRKGMVTASIEKSSGTGGGSNGKKVSVPNSNYVVPLDMSAAGLTRPLNEILRDLNKRVPDKIINPEDNSIPWYHANRMLSFYAPGWCGEVRDVIFSDNGRVTVVYRVTIRGSDGEAHRESAGTASSTDNRYEDPVAAAEEIAFCRACARFGFGLYLYHEDEAA